MKRIRIDFSRFRMEKQTLALCVVVVLGALMCTWLGGSWYKADRAIEAGNQEQVPTSDHCDRGQVSGLELGQDLDPTQVHNLSGIRWADTYDVAYIWRNLDCIPFDEAVKRVESRLPMLHAAIDKHNAFLDQRQASADELYASLGAISEPRERLYATIKKSCDFYYSSEYRNSRSAYAWTYLTDARPETVARWVQKRNDNNHVSGDLSVPTYGKQGWIHDSHDMLEKLYGETWGPAYEGTLPDSRTPRSYGTARQHVCG